MRISPLVLLTLFSISFLLPSHFASAVSIQGENKPVTFHLGDTYTYSYYIGGAERIEAYVDGDLPNLRDMVAVYDQSPGTGPPSIDVRINFNQDVPPGNYRIFVGAREIA